MGFEGRLTALGLVKEGTWGTDPTGTTTTIPLRSGTLDEDSTFKDYDDLYAGSTGVSGDAPSSPETAAERRRSSLATA